MEAAWRQLGLEGTVGAQRFSDAIAPVPEGHKLGKPEILFGKMEDATIKELDDIFKERMIQAESKDKKEKNKSMETISFEQFKGIDLRVGEIKEAERIKGSNKLLKLVVDIGTEKRQVVAGIAETYTPEDLVGTQAVVVANLERAKLFGVESQAMLLAADIGGKALLLRPQERVEPGTKVR
jgi:methionyl-tRNA synthetase